MCIYSTTTTTTTQDPIPQESQCTRAPARRNVFPARADLPADCSCFLSTTVFPEPTTVTTTTTKPVVPVVVPTTTYVTVTTQIIEVIRSTKTETASTTTTTTSTSTSTITQVSTSVVSTATATATAFFDFCNTLRPLSGQPAIRNGGQAVLGISSDAFGDPRFCCSNCALNANCVYFSLSQNNQYCEIFFSRRGVSPNNPCRSGLCTQGVQNYDATSDTAGGRQYYGGPCLAGSPGGN